VIGTHRVLSNHDFAALTGKDNLRVIVRAIDKAGNIREAPADIRPPFIITKFIKEYLVYILIFIVLIGLISFIIWYLFDRHVVGNSQQFRGFTKKDEQDKKITFSQADKVFLTELKTFVEKLDMESGKICTRIKELGITYDFSLKVASIPLFLETIPLSHPNRIRRANNMRSIMRLS